MITAVIVIQLVHLVYHQVTTLVDFFPFNGVRGSSWQLRLADAGGAFIPMAIPPVGFLLRNFTLMEIGVVCNFIILGGEICTWWVPYFFGPSPKWLEMYNKIQGPTITVIPRRTDGFAPNVEHLILMGLTLLATVATWVGYRSFGGTFSRSGWIACVVGVMVLGGTAYRCSFAGQRKAEGAH